MKVNKNTLINAVGAALSHAPFAIALSNHAPFLIALSSADGRLWVSGIKIGESTDGILAAPIGAAPGGDFAIIFRADPHLYSALMQLRDDELDVEISPDDCPRKLKLSDGQGGYVVRYGLSATRLPIWIIRDKTRITAEHVKRIKAFLDGQEGVLFRGGRAYIFDKFSALRLSDMPDFGEDVFLSKDAIGAMSRRGKSWYPVEVRGGWVGVDFAEYALFAPNAADDVAHYVDRIDADMDAEYAEPCVYAIKELRDVVDNLAHNSYAIVLRKDSVLLFDPVIGKVIKGSAVNGQGGDIEIHMHPDFLQHYLRAAGRRRQVSIARHKDSYVVKLCCGDAELMVSPAKSDPVYRCIARA